jgi:hypothetical protein
MIPFVLGTAGAEGSCSLTAASMYSPLPRKSKNGGLPCAAQGAVTALGSLVSNAQAMEAWARERRTNKEVDLRHEMLTLLRRLELDVRSSIYLFLALLVF